MFYHHSKRKAYSTMLLISIHPIYLNISMHILDTVLCAFLGLLTERICFTIKRFFSW